MSRKGHQLRQRVAPVEVLEERLRNLLGTLGICYGQDEQAAVLALMYRLGDLGENPTRIARDAVQKAPKWRLSDAELDGQ